MLSRPETGERRRQKTAEEVIEPRPASVLDDAEPAFPRRWRRVHRLYVALQDNWRACEAAAALTRRLLRGNDGSVRTSDARYYVAGKYDA
jgi:hypothetical protein